jgi:putative glutamine amidotransferase
MNLYSGYYSQRDPFGIFNKTINIVDGKDLQNDGVLILWGGEDISPSIYNQDPVHTHAPNRPSMRDAVEIGLAKTAMQKGIPIIGICRGAQLLCALSGGSLFQHIDGPHHRQHKVITNDGEWLWTSSCHHQALNIEGTDGVVLAKDVGTVTAYTDKAKFDTVIPEVVHFPKNKILAIQGHPEWMTPDEPFVQWCSKQIESLLFPALVK